MAEPRKVFISYDTADLVHADELSHGLKDAGFAPWFINDPLGSASWATEIEEAVAAAQAAVVLLGPSKLEDRFESSLLRERAQDPSFRLIEIEPRERGSFNRAIDLLSGAEPALPALSPSVTQARRQLLARGGQLVGAYSLALEVAVLPRLRRRHGGSIRRR